MTDPLVNPDRTAQPMTEARLQEIETAGGLGRLSDWLESQIVLDLVDEIRRLQETAS